MKFSLGKPKPLSKLMTSVMQCRRNCQLLLFYRKGDFYVNITCTHFFGRIVHGGNLPEMQTPADCGNAAHRYRTGTLCPGLVRPFHFVYLCGTPQNGTDYYSFESGTFTEYSRFEESGTAGGADVLPAGKL